MYTLTKEPIAWIDVDWTSLAPGSAEEASVEVQRSIRVKVAFLSRTELAEVLDGTRRMSVPELAARVARDWAGVVDEDKRPLAFTPELLSQVMEHEPGFAIGFEASYLKAAIGQGKVREKNSEGSPSDGRAEESPAPASTSS